MGQEIPANVALGLTMGGAAGATFFIANLYVLLHLIKQVIAPKAQWKWLNAMRDKWHYVHYFGNIAACILTVVHAVLLLQFASVFHWILLALMAWMVFAGFAMRFTKVSPQFKRVLRNFHAKWYMFVILLALIIIAHLASLSSFPYQL